MITSFRDLWPKLRDKTFREGFVESEVKRGIPFQLRALLKKRGWSQDELAQFSGLTQGAVSRALNPNYGNLTLNTIIRLAAGFDVAFVGKFVPFSAMLDNHDDVVATAAGHVADFPEEDDDAEQIIAALEEKSAEREANDVATDEPNSRAEMIREFQRAVAKKQAEDDAMAARPRSWKPPANVLHGDFGDAANSVENKRLAEEFERYGRTDPSARAKNPSAA